MTKAAVITSKQQSLLRSTSLVSLMTFISRILGFIRDMILAQFFGAEAGMDAFIIAFRIPNFMRRLFAEGAFSQAFVPVLAEYQKTREVADIRLFMARVAGTLSSVLTLITVFGVMCAPGIVFLFAPGFGEDASRTFLATEMLRLTFPYLMLISLTAMAGAVLNTYGYFGVPAITPVLLNICMIIAAIFVSPHFHTPILALAWGVLVAGIVQLLFQLPFLWHRGLLVKPQIYFADEGVRRVLKLMVPALFGVSIAQFNLMIDTIFASFLKVGSVTWLFYTDRLTDFPLGVFGVAIATVVLPHLSKRHAEQHLEHFSNALDWGLRLLLLIGVPAAIGLSVFSMPMIVSCFAYGKFEVLDVLQTQKSLIALSLGVPAFMMVKVLASGFYARQDIKTPVKVGVWAMILNSILCAFLIIPLAHAGLALASTLAGYFNCAILMLKLRRQAYYRPSKDWSKFFLQLLAANAFLAIYLYAIRHDVTYWMDEAMAHRLFLLLGHVLSALLVYVVSLGLVGVRPSQFRGQKESR